MADFCEHTHCGFENRLDYCEIEAADRNGSVEIVTEMLDELVYEAGPVTSKEYHSSSERAGQSVTRSFSYLQGDLKSWVWPITETVVAIRHLRDKQLKREKYEVAVSWAVKQVGISDDPFVTTYSIEVYEQGPVKACVEQPQVEQEGQLQNRRLTSFDLETLFTELEIVYELHAAERKDNARALTAE